MSRPTHPLTSVLLLVAGWLLTVPGLSQAQTTQAPQREVLDRVIAIVDDGVILQSEYESRMQEIRQMAQQNDQALPPEDALRDEVMESLIMETLQLQGAERVGIRIDDDTLNRVIGQLANQNDMSFDEYVDALQDIGQYETTREQIRRDLTINEVQRAMVNRRISITEQEIENYINSERGRASLTPEYRVNQLLIPVSNTDSPGQIEAREDYAHSLYQRIQNGEAFAEVLGSAEQNSQDIPVRGGGMGWAQLDELPTLFAEVVADMSIGEAHEPLRSANGLHVLYLQDVRGDPNRLVSQVRVRHILISPSEIRTENQARRLIEDLYQQIQDGESFSTLARQYSDDDMTVVAGGDMGWNSEEEMPLELQEQISEMETGEISEPFHTNAGWHIAEVQERRERDLSRQYRRRLAENALRERKFDLELENWLAELRDEAYVEIL